MLVNIVGFNLSWLGLVLIGDSFIPITLCWLIYHVYQSQNWRVELALICFVTSFGIVVDSTLVFSGVLSFAQHTIIPLWLITLWASFGATIFHSLKFLANSKLLQFSVGFIFPALSYITGASLSAVELPNGVYVTYFVLAPVWALLFMLFFQCADYIKRIDNYAK